MSDSIGTAADKTTATNPGPEVAHEAYSFACMRCSHAWEQSYDIEHHVDGEGRPVVTYLVDGRRVPSPLSRPTCANCDGHLVRIMQSGRVNNPDLQWPRPTAGATEGTQAAEGAGTAEGHHWHLPHIFHRKPGGGA